MTYTGEPTYVSSKHAQVAFADCLLQDVAPGGIKEPSLLLNRRWVHEVLNVPDLPASTSD